MTTAVDAKPKRILNWWRSHESFIAPTGYPSSFRIGWGSPPVCGRCGAAIQPGDRVVWTGSERVRDPKQLCHVECVREKGMVQ